MSIDTDLSQSPYFDDFNANNQFYKILYRPTAPIQIREVNQTQTNMQYQIEKFGKNIFVDGSIVDGCKITFNSSLPYCKILDSYANNFAINVSDLGAKYVQSTNGLRAFVFDTESGFISQAPNLNTIYVNYLNSSSDTTVSVFQENEILTVYNAANVAIGQITVANSSISGANSSVTGLGYSITVGNGTIFHKGYFLDVQKQSLIISKYNNYPDQLSVGFNTVETIVTPEENTTLLDNTAGASNYAAPGAHRLKLTPTLVTRATNSTSSNNFFSIVDFVAGNPAVIRQSSEYSTLGDAMAQRTDESAGNFVISPFNLRAITKYQSDGITLDTSNVKLEIDPGLAYVHGYRVETKGKLINQLRKGNDVGQTTSQTLTTTLGNYIFVKEFAGIFDPTSNVTVSLRSATSTAITTSLSKGIAVSGIAAAGVEIGKANIVAVEYESGTPGTPTAQYRVYLTNIVLNSGYNFNSIRSLYFSGTSNGVADVILDINGNAKLYETNLGSMVYPFNQKAIKTLKDATNTISGQFDFYQTTSVNFNTSGVATVTIPSYVGGSNILPYGTGTLDNNTEKDFIITVTGTALTSNNAGTITASGNTVTGTSTTFTTSYIVGSMISLTSGANTEIRQITAIANNTSLSLSSNLTNTYSGGSHAQAYVSGQEIPSYLTSSSITINSSTVFTINLNQTFTSTFTSNIQYRIRRTSANPAKKVLNGPIYVCIDTSTHPNGINGPWCLGVPDVTGILNVYAGTTFSANNPDIASQCTYDNGQRDTYYGLGYLYNNNATITSGTKILVKLMAYNLNTSTGIGFFSVDSYPVDDTGLTANTIYTKNIPTYGSYNLRNCVDFRKYVSNTIVYSANLTSILANTTPVLNPSSNTSFINNGYNPVVDSSFESAVQYYMGRYDKVGFTTKGSVVIIEGNPSENPVPPANISSGITLATVLVPPYPTLTVDDASTGIVSFTYNKNRRYTMSDIGNLDDRISQVEYYTTLNALELSAKNLMITNASGQNRMQNGIIADPFCDFSICNTLDTQFNIAIDSANCEARPIINQNLIDLKYQHINGDNISISSDGRVISLLSTENTTPYMSQPFASETRNAAQDTMYVWTGNITLNPTGDYQADVTTNPDVVVTSDSYSNFANMPNPWPTQWGNWEETGSSSSSSSTNQFVAVSSAGALGAAPVYNPGHAAYAAFGLTLYQTYADAQVTTTTTNANYTQTGTQYSIAAANNTYNFGSYVTDISIQPYCRANLIKFIATGMKPNTKLYAWMDDTNVTVDCVLTDSNYNIIGTTLVTDSSGTCYGMYYLPANTFRTGDRQFQLCDVNNLITLSNSITTTCTSTYYGSNLSYAKNNVTLNTITPQVVTTSVTKNKTVSSTTSDVTGVNSYIWTDPLAQGISIIDQKFGSDDIQGIFVSSINLYFESKDPTLGVTIMIRDMDNGYPGPNIQNFSQVHLIPSQINVSTDATIATKVTFSAPVLLETGSQYCIVIMPDGSNPNYNLWCGKLGKNDVTSGSPIYSISGCGDLFSSSQNSTWTAYQSERLKFDLFTYNFNSLSGTAHLVNDDSEYFSIKNTNGGTFKLGETVYAVSNDLIANAVTITNSNTVNVTNSAIFTVGETVVLRNSSTSQVVVANVNTLSTSTQIALSVAVPFTSNTISIGTVVGSGALNGEVKSANSTNLVLGNSTANTTYQFSNSVYLVGTISGAYANVITLNDVPYDYLMPKLSISTQNDTGILVSVNGTSNAGLGYIADTTSSPLTLGTTTEFIDKERCVMSKSHEVLYNSGNKSLTLNASLMSATNVITPFIDTLKLGATVVQNNINGDDANNTIYTSEITNNGKAINRYISMTVNLATGMDSEDLIVYLGAYWPDQTEILVYGKFLNSYDPDPFSSKLWTPMNTTNNIRSSKVNKQDINEYIFTLPTTSPSDSTAYLNSGNLNILRYTSTNGQVYDSYKTFAIKIVLLSSAGSYLVPRLSDMRAIATPSSS